MERLNVFLLHGFLGRPADWGEVRKYISKIDNVSFHAVDYMSNPLLSSVNSFNEWAKNFNQYAGSISGRRLLVGYSLGGRLALHALREHSELWDQSILISTNPGFDDSSAGEIVGFKDREQRWIKDTEWANLFKSAPWESLIRSWNAQPVFNESQAEPVRLEKDYERHLLELALTTWSLASQENMRSVLQELAAKIVWMTGALDQKFLGQAEALRESGYKLSYVNVDGASHRVLFDQPAFIAAEIQSWIQKFT